MCKLILIQPFLLK